MSDHPRHVAEALRLGAWGYLLKGSPSRELLQAVETVTQQRRYLSPAAAEVNAWLANMAGGASREAVVEGFAQSQEFINGTAGALKTWVRAQGWHDELNGGAGSNVLAGGILADRFVFDTTDGGSHTVLDLEAWDLMAFQNFGYASAADARSHMTQSGADVVFSDQGVTVTLEHVTLAQIADDMVLV